MENNNDNQLVYSTERKPVILICTDGPTVTTGFGKVCYNLVSRLHATKKYQIVVMATNDRGKAHPMRALYPEVIIEPLPYIGEDPYGAQALPDMLKKYQPDLVLAVNDLWVWTSNEMMPQLDNWFFRALKAYKPYVPFIGYFPVDGRPWEQRWVNAANAMTYAVTFTNYGYKVLAETPNMDLAKIKKIYHGHDHENFYPISDDEKLKMRKEMNIPEDAFLVTNVNRNQPRKDIPSTIRAFKMFSDGYVVCNGCGHYKAKDWAKDCEYCGSLDFKEGKDGTPKAYLYLHMNPYDGRGYRLPKVVADAKAKNVVLMRPYDVADGIPIDVLNKIYNISDVFVNCAMAGGYELTNAEAMSAGTPVIATRTTSIIEQLEDERGYLVNPAAILVYADASHTLKHMIDVDKLVDTLYHVYENQEEAKQRAVNAMAFAHTRTWEGFAKEFETLIDQALTDRALVHKFCKKDVPNLLLVNESFNAGEVLSMIPALNEIALRDAKTNLLLACPAKFHTLMTNLSKRYTLLDSQKIWFENSELQGLKLQVHSISEIPNKLIAASATAGVPVPSHVESYFKGFNLNYEPEETFKQKDLLIAFTDEEILKAKELIAYNEDKFNVVLICNRDTHMIMPKKWQEIIDKVSGVTDINLTAIGNNATLDELTNVRIVKDLNIRSVMSILAACDTTVTSSDEYILCSNYIDTPFIIIPPGGFNIEHLVKHSKRNHDGQLLAERNIIPNCVPYQENQTVLDVQYAVIFAKILGMRAWWLADKKRKSKVIEVITEE